MGRVTSSPKTRSHALRDDRYANTSRTPLSSASRRKAANVHAKAPRTSATKLGASLSMATNPACRATRDSSTPRATTIASSEP